MATLLCSENGRSNVGKEKRAKREKDVALGQTTMI